MSAVRSLVNDFIKNTNGSLKSSLGKGSHSKCGRCGLSKSSSPSKKSNNEFATIQLDDIFTNYAPQKSPHQSSTSENNNERRRSCEETDDDVCPSCALPPPSSSPPSTLVQHSSLPNGIVNGKAEIPGDALRGTPTGRPPILPTGGTGTSVIITTQPTPRINYYTSNGNGSTNGVVESPLPVSVVLPLNGHGSRATTTDIPIPSGLNQIRHINGSSSSPNPNSSLGSPTPTNGHDLFPYNTRHGLGLISLTCTLCNKHFKNERLAISHQERLHGSLARYTCPSCNGKFCYR